MGPRGREEVVIHCGVVAVTMEGRGEAPPGPGHMELSVTRAVPAQARGRVQQEGEQGYGSADSSLKKLGSEDRQRKGQSWARGMWRKNRGSGSCFGF